MIEFKSGNLLQADVEALVNTVNTVGVMGKGIALQFKQAFPENFAAYERAAKRGRDYPRPRCLWYEHRAICQSSLHYQLPHQASLARQGPTGRH